MKEIKADKNDLILDTAEKLFSLHGYDGASTRLIASEAGVNIAMLNYYFGSKEGVYKGVLERRFKGFHQVLTELNEKDISSWDKLNHFVEIYSGKILTQNCFHKLIQREMSLQKRSETGEFLTQHMLKNTNEVRKILSEGIKNGSFREVDVELTVATIFGTNYYLISLSPVASLLLDKDLQDQEVIETEIKPRVKKHLQDLLNAHLRKI